MTKKDKIKWFHVLLYRTHMMANKADMLASYGVSSSKDLSDRDLDELIDYLKRIYEEKESTKKKEIRQWRHKVLRMVAKCGIDTQDWNKVNAFMCQPRIAGKHLYECDLQKLKVMHRKLHNVAQEKEKKAKEERFKAMMN